MSVQTATLTNLVHRCLAVLLFAMIPIAGLAAEQITSPETVMVDGQDGVIRIRNQALSLTWRTAEKGLRLESVQDVRSQTTLTLTGELFQIVLADGRRYGASSLAPAGKPTVESLPADLRSARLAGRLPRQQIELPLRSTDGLLRVRWRAIVQDQANYVRQEIVLTPSRDCVIKEVVWFDEPLPGARTVGQVDGCPVVAGPFFLGIEDPHASNHAAAGDGGSGPPLGQASSGRTPVSCRVRRHAPLRQGESLTQSFVWGIAPLGQLRRAFLGYLEHERAHPYRPFLHYNSWYDISWAPFALNETNCLAAIRLLGERFIKPHEVIMDSIVFDDGWDNPQTLWQFHAGFPRGFKPLAELAKHYHTRLGVWLSPFGGYGKPKQERLKFGREQGYEINQAGLSLAGPKYYAAFKNACVHMIRDYGVNHFKFDGIAGGTYARGGGDYLLDTEAMRCLMLELRQEDPNLYLNLTTGSWPSPFWLRYADSLWRQGHDMGLAGKGPKQQQWLTYRDREVYRNIVRQSPLYPLNSLMTQGVAYSRHGPAGERSFNSAGFKDDVHAFFGSGTGLQELYLQPGKLTSADWTVLAEAAKWSRAHADVLVDTHWIGGDPGQLEVYGYAAWSPRRGVLMLRNPDDQPREFMLDVADAFELPPGASTHYRLKSPWAEDAGQPPLSAEAGKPLSLRLEPLQVIVLNALPLP